MSRTSKLEHVFVEYLPERLDDGVLYVALSVGTVAHLCCCGCGLEVVTPLSRTDWSLIYDGEAVSLYPSIGNWSFPCRSHYWIRHNEVTWAARWWQTRIDAGREHDRLVKQSRYGGFASGGRSDVWLERYMFMDEEPVSGDAERVSGAADAGDEADDAD